MKTKKKKPDATRKLAEKIQRMTGFSFAYIDRTVKHLIEIGHAKNRKEAMQEVYLLAKDL